MCPSSQKGPAAAAATAAAATAAAAAAVAAAAAALHQSFYSGKCKEEMQAEETRAEKSGWCGLSCSLLQILLRRLDSGGPPGRVPFQFAVIPRRFLEIPQIRESQAGSNRKDHSSWWTG